MGQFEKALQAARETLDADPTKYHAHYFAARALIREGNVDEGRAQMGRYQELLARAEQDEDASRVRATGRAAAERFLAGEGPAAVRALESLVETYPNDPVARLNLGIAQLRLELTEAAIDSFQTMLDLGLGDFMVHKNLADGYEALGDTPPSSRHRAAFFLTIGTALGELSN